MNIESVQGAFLRFAEADEEVANRLTIIADEIRGGALSNHTRAANELHRIARSLRQSSALIKATLGDGEPIGVLTAVPESIGSTPSKEATCTCPMGLRSSWGPDNGMQSAMRMGPHHSRLCPMWTER